MTGLYSKALLSRVPAATEKRVAPPRVLTAQERSCEFSHLAQGATAVQAEFAARRGIKDIDAFSQPSPGLQSAFSKLPGVQDSFRVIRSAFSARTGKVPLKFAVCGDFDVDGIASVAIISHGLKALGCEVSTDTPCRRNEGYGLNFRMVEAAYSSGCSLLFALDFGTTQHQVLGRAKELGLSVIVIDHHRLGEFPLPHVDAIINPNARGGVLKNACAAELCRLWVNQAQSEFGIKCNESEIMAIGALATVADVMPLNDRDNRATVREGLRCVGETKGLKALCEALKIQGDVAASDLAFSLGPVLNAPGRIRARDDVELGALECQQLLQGRGDLAALSESVISANQDRKVRERADYQRALQLLGSQRRVRTQIPRGIVVASEHFDPGVAGLVSSRLTERYCRPSVVIALDGSVGRGSVRGVTGFDAYVALNRLRAYLQHFGGHQAAAGLKINLRDIPEFIEAFAEEVERQLGPFKEPTLEADFSMSLPEFLDRRTALHEDLSIFEPFGNQNSAPCILLRGVVVERFHEIGVEHYVVTVSDQNRSTEAYFWRGVDTPLAQRVGKRVDLGCRLSRYRPLRSRHSELSLEIVGEHR